MERPDFKNIKSYQEFSQFYWYRDELIQICKSLKLEYSGTKLELNHIIEQYFKGNLIRRKPREKKIPITVHNLTPDTGLLECGFCFNGRFRDFFINQTGVSNFKFNTDMVATAKKVKADHDTAFTLGDMLDIYYGKKEYAKNDKSACQWNQFLKDFCADEENAVFPNKLKTASILWSEVRDSTEEKVYTKELVRRYKERESL